MNRVVIVFLILLCGYGSVWSKMLIPMNDKQTDHLKAYGIVYEALKLGVRSYWLLNYEGGSFVLDDSRAIAVSAARKGVAIKMISNGEFAQILSTVENNNMEKVTLEKAPKIAVYTPPGKLPWDDAVTLALEYAEIPYDKIYDKEVITNKLKEYDWLHLHHEDFTGQYSKFYKNYNGQPWFQKQRMLLEKQAKELGFKTVPQNKKAVALAIKEYVEKGGFLFAMCSAPNTLDIALASAGTDIVEDPFDGDGVDPQFRKKLNFDNCFAFENFTIDTRASVGHFGNIDFNRVNTPQLRQPAMDFELFSFSAKLDPVPTMLIQNHVSVVHKYYGLLTSFNRKILKKSVVILGHTPGTDRVKYIHGVKGKGQFAFLGGHDPEDVEHHVGDLHTMLELHKNSPGYRLILNNVLFPAAEKKEKKT